MVTVEGRGEDQKVWVVSGFRDLVVLKSTGSEFKGFLKDKYTTLQETDDRIMATALTARWRYDGTDADRDLDWDACYEEIKAIMLSAFATTYSRALQETLYVMGKGVMKARHEIAEVRFSAPNKHHFLVDLGPFDLEEQRRGLHRRRPALRADRGNRFP